MRSVGMVEDPGMTPKVEFARYLDGEPLTGGGDRMRETLTPWVVHEDPARQFLRLRFDDNSVDVHLDNDRMAVVRISGAGHGWADVLVEGARRADWAILPRRGPWCVTSESQRPHVPADDGERVVLVNSGDDLLGALRASSDDPSIEERIRHAQQQVRIYEALSRAFGDAHAVLDLIMNAADRDGASVALQEAYGFDEMQAAAVLDLQFRRVGTRERSQIREAHREAQAHLDALTAEHAATPDGDR
jgi:hypothetical protein